MVKKHDTLLNVQCQMGCWLLCQVTTALCDGEWKQLLGSRSLTGGKSFINPLPYRHPVIPIDIQSYLLKFVRSLEHFEVSFWPPTRYDWMSRALIPPSVACVCFKSLDGVVPPKNLWFLLVDVFFLILLMEEILHHLGYIKPCK